MGKKRDLGGPTRKLASEDFSEEVTSELQH